MEIIQVEDVINTRIEVVQPSLCPGWGHLVLMGIRVGHSEFATVPDKPWQLEIQRLGVSNFPLEKWHLIYKKMIKYDASKPKTSACITQFMGCCWKLLMWKAVASRGSAVWPPDLEHIHLFMYCSPSLLSHSTFFMKAIKPFNYICSKR